MNDIPSRNGSRQRKSVTDTGVHRKLAGAGGTGRKGAIAVPATFRVSFCSESERRVTYGVANCTFVAELAILLHGVKRARAKLQLWGASCHRDM